MSDYSINFSNEEMSLMQDQKFLLAKMEIGKKIEELMQRVERKLYPSIQEYPWPEEVLSKSGKISKGENYQGLPYYMLDFPRKFGKEGIFAFRTMFWWGNFFSATLHLSGKYLENRRGALLTNLETIRSSQAYICVNNTPWDYHYASNNYQSASKFDSPQLHSLLTTKPFMKISFHWPLEIYPELPAVALSTFRQVQGWMIEH